MCKAKSSDSVRAYKNLHTPLDLLASRGGTVPVVAGEAAEAQVRVILAGERTPIVRNRGRSGDRRTVGSARAGPGWAVAEVAAEAAETDVVAGAGAANAGAARSGRGGGGISGGGGAGGDGSAGRRRHGRGRRRCSWGCRGRCWGGGRSSRRRGGGAGRGCRGARPAAAGRDHGRGDGCRAEGRSSGARADVEAHGQGEESVALQRVRGRLGNRADVGVEIVNPTGADVGDVLQAAGAEDRGPVADEEELLLAQGHINSVHGRAGRGAEGLDVVARGDGQGPRLGEHGDNEYRILHVIPTVGEAQEETD